MIYYTKYFLQKNLISLYFKEKREHDEDYIDENVRNKKARRSEYSNPDHISEPQKYVVKNVDDVFT